MNIIRPVWGPAIGGAGQSCHKISNEISNNTNHIKLWVGCSCYCSLSWIGLIKNVKRNCQYKKQQHWIITGRARQCYLGFEPLFYWVFNFSEIPCNGRMSCWLKLKSTFLCNLTEPRILNFHRGLVRGLCGKNMSSIRIFIFTKKKFLDKQCPAKKTGLVPIVQILWKVGLFILRATRFMEMKEHVSICIFWKTIHVRNLHLKFWGNL